MLAGERPAVVPDAVIAEIRSRERDGLIELPKPPGFKRGYCVRIVAGAFDGHLALYQGQTAHERVAVLLRLLGASSGQSFRRAPSSRWSSGHDFARG